MSAGGPGRVSTAAAPALARPDPARLRARLVLGTGGALLAAGLVLLALVERADVSQDGGLTTGAHLVHVALAVPFLLLGTLMLARVPRHPIGWIYCAAALGGLLSDAGLQYATYSHYVDRLPAGTWAGWVGEWASAPIFLLVTAAPLLFPSGRPPSRRWNPVLWLGLAAIATIALSAVLGTGDDLPFQGNPFLPDATAGTLGDIFSFGYLLVPVTMVAGVAAIVVRWRAARGPARDELRLLLRAAAAVVIAFGVSLLTALIAGHVPIAEQAAGFLALEFLAASMGVAIVRHHLYGLDVFVDHALVYTGLTIVLGGLYVAAVLLGGRLLGEDVQLEVALPATALVAVAFGPLRARLQRSVNRLLHGLRDEPYAAISTLGRRLGEAMAPAQVLPVMVATIADSLRVPYVAVQLAGTREPAATHGAPVAGVALSLPLVHAGETVGTLLIGARAHDEALSDADRRLLEDFARRASAAASAVALSLEVQHSRERLVSAREEERRRLRGDLHDGLGPTLAGAVLTIDAARRVLARDPETADQLLDRAAASVEGTVADVRRLVYGLRPPALDQLGLVGALQQHTAALTLDGAGLSADVVAPDAMPALPAAVEVAAFRIAQEALTNVTRHARARRAEVRLAVEAERLCVEISDDGDGIPAGAPAGIGMTSMRERATELGGDFEVTSASGAGTVVAVHLPLPRA
jgi:signal transduction histidine kinase